jgi:hypothetical protein
MTAAWPGTIDHQPVNGYAHVFADRRGRGEVEQGIARQRSLYSAALMTLNMVWAFSNAKFETFRTFYDRTVNCGDQFTIDVFTGSAYQNVTANFVKGKLRTDRQGGEWIVSADLETDELPVMSSGALDALIGAAGAGLPAWPAQLPSQPLNESLNVAFPDPLIRADFDDGYAPQRRVFFAAPATYAAVIPLSYSQYDLFRAWRKYRILNGQGWFTMPVFRGNSYQTRTVRIAKGGLKASWEGPDWLLNIALEMRDLPAFA